MNYLQLCQRLHVEAGMSGSSPTTVVDQTGEAARVVNWIETAYEDIQNLHHNWKFLEEEFSGSTVASTQTYTKSDLSLTELESWKTDDFRIYSSVSDETFLEYFPWYEFRSAYDYGSFTTQESRPTVCSVNQDESLVLWPIPDAVYTVGGEYYKRAQTMSANTDTPLLPQQFHMIIVWRALMFYAGYEEAPAVYSHAYNEYKRILPELEFNQLPPITWGPSFV